METHEYVIWTLIGLVILLIIGLIIYFVVKDEEPNPIESSNETEVIPEINPEVIPEVIPEEPEIIPSEEEQESENETISELMPTEEEYPNPNFLTLDNTDLSTVTIPNTAAISISNNACAQRCLDLDQCDLYVYNTETGECLPKQGVAWDPTVLSSYDRNTDSFTQRSGVDVHGYGIENMKFNTYTHPECLQLCKETPDCNFFTFNTKTGDCWLKHAPDRQGYQTNFRK